MYRIDEATTRAPSDLTKLKIGTGGTVPKDVEAVVGRDAQKYVSEPATHIERDPSDVLVDEAAETVAV
jgi:hypothetical protein